MDAAKAHYESSEAQLSYAEVRSPMNGVVSDRPVNIGEMASSGSALLSIVDISQVVARANIPVQEAAAMKVGDPATISGFRRRTGGQSHGGESGGRSQHDHGAGVGRGAQSRRADEAWSHRSDLREYWRHKRRHHRAGQRAS